MIVIRLVRDRAVLRESVFPILPITIGRGADNDFVVGDMSVSRRHARLEESSDGVPILRDAGSRNGIRVGAKIITETTISGRLRLRFGLAELEIESVEEAETKELRREEWRRFSRKRAGLRVIGSLLLGVSGWIAYRLLEADFWSPWQKHRALTLLSNSVMALLILPIIAFVLLIVLRTVGRPVRVSDTLAFLSRIIWLYPVGAIITFAAYYHLSLTARSILSSMLESFIAIVVVVGSASLRRSRPSTRFRVIWATALLTVIVSISLLTNLERRRNGVPQIEYNMQMPLAGYAGRSQPLETYLNRLKRATETAADKASEIHARQEKMEH